MIKYPVRAYVLNPFNIHIEDANYNIIAESGSLEDANTVVNALNAINEFPVKAIQSYLIMLQSGKLGPVTMEQLEDAGSLHGILEKLR